MPCRLYFYVAVSHLRPKSAGISPHNFVSHFTIGTVIACVASQRSARAMSSKTLSLRPVRSSFVLHFFCFIHNIALRLSLHIVKRTPCCSIHASAWTIAKNSPMLFVPSSKGPALNIGDPSATHTPRYSIFPGLPRHEASTATASDNSFGIWHGAVPLSYAFLPVA